VNHCFAFFVVFSQRPGSNRLDVTRAKSRTTVCIKHVNAAGFVPISYTIGSSGRVTVLGVYGDFIVLTQITATGKVLYEGTLTAINPGTTQLISRWECVCHPGVTQEVVTDINGSMKPEWYQDKHDERLALALRRHPAKTQQ